MTGKFGIVAIVFSCTLISNSTARGGRVEFIPNLGLYAPTGHVLLPTDDFGLFTDTGVYGFHVAYKHQLAGAYGCRFTFWMKEHLAIEGGLLYARSDVLIKSTEVPPASPILTGFRQSTGRSVSVLPPKSMSGEAERTCSSLARQR